jgi:hypothetical protein
MKVRTDDSTEAEGGSGAIAVIPPGHNNAWIVVGDEPCVMIIS